MAIELLDIVVGVIVVGVIVVGAAAGFFLIRGLLRKRPRDRRRDPNAQTKCGATPLHRAAPARPETKSKRGKKRQRKRKAGAKDHTEALDLADPNAEARALADPNAWNLDDASAVDLIDAGVDQIDD